MKLQTWIAFDIDLISMMIILNVILDFSLRYNLYCIEFHGSVFNIHFAI